MPCRPSIGVPSERLRLVKRFISHRLHTGACVNLVLLTYLLTLCGESSGSIKLKVDPQGGGSRRMRLLLEEEATGKGGSKRGRLQENDDPK